MGTIYQGPSSTDALLFTISECLEDWGDDPAYAPAAQKLREVQRELDAITQSPGLRQAARLAPPDQSGQGHGTS
jgi:hypothetical protein